MDSGLCGTTMPEYGAFPGVWLITQCHPIEQIDVLPTDSYQF